MHAAKLITSPRLQRIYNLLSGDHEEHSTREIIQKCNVCAVNSAVSELRANGLNIVCRQRPSRNGKHHYTYQLLED